MEMTKTNPAPPQLSFENTEIGFRHLSKGQLNFSYWVFKLMSYPRFVHWSSQAALLSLRLHLPVQWLIKATIFRQFCGGETQQECVKTVKQLGKAGIGAILDYSVEGAQEEKDFDSTAKELVEVIRLARNDDDIPIGCMKVTGIARYKLLEKVSAGTDLTAAEREEYARVVQRFDQLCRAAYECDVPLYVDAEETWIQPAIDRLAESMMRQFNRKRAIVFTTLQLYRHDRLAKFKELIEQARKEGFVLGVKLVRGAYLEKENKRAQEKGYPTPMQPSKAATDGDYNAALQLALDNLDVVEVCAGTHNEESCLQLVQWMDERGLQRNHPHVYFSQLYGMSDYMSYNLASAGANVTKYLPYGPVKPSLPYLIRRAQENTSIAGQMGKELRLILREKKRRKTAR